MSDFDLYESEIEELYRPKEEPKVVLTVEEAKRIMDYIDGVVFISNELQMHIEHLFKPLKDGIEQAEKGYEVK